MPVRPHTETILRLLHRYESRNVTFIDPDGSWPIVWDRAKGVHVWDADGKRYLDLTAAFGVAAAGHANPRVIRAGRHQMGRLLHAMGDVHPHELKARLARELSRITFERWHRDSCNMGRWARTGGEGVHGKVIFCNSGFEAVEAGLKTALLATQKPGVVAFKGAYHGLGYGALAATHREFFRRPFLPQLASFAHFIDFPRDAKELGRIEPRIQELLEDGGIGAILVEPIQGRGGVNVPPPQFLPLLRRLCDQHQAILILDEVYTGMGRTGKWFACEHWGIAPDVLCLGKALTGGFPLSACVGEANLMDQAWPPTAGEAIHTSTFLGHPVGCAMALAQIRELRERRLPQSAARLGVQLLKRLERMIAPDGIELKARGLGLMVGLELSWAGGEFAPDLVLKLVKQMLNHGFILLPEGQDAQVLAFTPPLSITARQLDRAVSVLQSLLESLGIGLRPKSN